MSPELNTAIWHDGGDEITPLAVIEGAVLTPPVGAHIDIDGTRYRVTAPPEINYLGRARYRPDGTRLPEAVSAVLTVVNVGPPEGF